MEDKTISTESQVPAVLKTFTILEYLLTHDRATIKDICAHSKVSQASTTRIIKTLTNLGYLEQDQDNSSSVFSIGQGFLKFYHKAKSNINLEEVARPIMEELCSETEQTSQLAVIDGYTAQYILSVNTNVMLGITAPLFAPIPINVSAGAKAICANLSEDTKLEIIKKAVMPSYTKNTVTDKVELLLHLSETKKRGYEFDNEEYAMGICCIAAPIFNHMGNAVAAVGITGPSSKYSDEADFEKLVKSVSQAAKSISRKLGNQG